MVAASVALTQPHERIIVTDSIAAPCELDVGRDSIPRLRQTYGLTFGAPAA